ncbi:hypothetical protein M3936_03880 [Sutcliffiella horikoshii]|uniref:hypothetical protein n=1 Tax=Sutcliffiella horikoshii TaxID=79883 RepID=UPI00203CB942|nr:hypothetical protein [Sutcliffiella horikoshii]MCM3616717.1 hypothetical protein [Sutcliffiella horikoshii]
MACMFHVMFSFVLLFNVSACQSKSKVESAISLMQEQMIKQEKVDVIVEVLDEVDEVLRFYNLQGLTKYNLIFIGKSRDNKMKFYIPEFKSRGFRLYRRGIGLDLNKELDI